MAPILCLLGDAYSSYSTPPHENSRKRLRKAPPKANPFQDLYSCKGDFNIFRAQSCWVSLEADESSSLTNLEENESEETLAAASTGPGFEAAQEDRTETSIHKCQSDEMDAERLRRTSAKTPVFAVEQLERNQATQQVDKTQTLAEQYQALLPPRGFTPCMISSPKPAQKDKTLRKVKCQLSLRDMVKEQSNRGHSVAYSDSETLIGSDSPTLPSSPTDAEFKRVELPVIDPYAQVSFQSAACGDDVGLKICIDLLTNELATALFRQHPTEGQDRASGLQILLMIEAYETIQKNVRQQLCDPQITQEMTDHVTSVDELLRYWLKVLYSVYDQSQEQKLQKVSVEDQRLNRNTPEGFLASDKDPN